MYLHIVCLSMSYQHTGEGVDKATEPGPLLQQNAIEVLFLSVLRLLEVSVCLLGRGGEEGRVG